MFGNSQAFRALSACVSALAETADHQPARVPYRDSKLTWLLRDALGGGAPLGAGTRVTVVACCSGEDEQIESTIATLRFAQKCRHACVWLATVEGEATDAGRAARLLRQRPQFPAARLCTDSSSPLSTARSSAPPLAPGTLAASKALALQRGPEESDDSD